MPDNVRERPAWYAAEQTRIKRQQTKGSGRELGADRQLREFDQDYVERYWWAKQHPERAAEVGATFADRTKPLRNLEYVDGVPRLVPAVTRSNGS